MAIRSDGTQSAARVNPSGINPAAAFSFGLSVYVDDASTTQGIFAVGNPNQDTPRGFSLVVRSGGIRFRWLEGVQIGSGTIADGTWIRVAVSYDPADSSRIRVGINGTEIASSVGDAIGALTTGDSIAFFTPCTFADDATGVAGAAAGALWVQGTASSLATIDAALQDLCAVEDPASLWLLEDMSDIGTAGNTLTNAGTTADDQPSWVPSSCDAGGLDATVTGAAEAHADATAGVRLVGTITAAAEAATAATATERLTATVAGAAEAAVAVTATERITGTVAGAAEAAVAVAATERLTATVAGAAEAAVAVSATERITGTAAGAAEASVDAAGAAADLTATVTGASEAHADASATLRLVATVAAAAESTAGAAASVRLTALLAAAAEAGAAIASALRLVALVEATADASALVAAGVRISGTVAAVAEATALLNEAAAAANRRAVRVRDASGLLVRVTDHSGPLVRITERSGPLVRASSLPGILPT